MCFIGGSGWISLVLRLLVFVRAVSKGFGYFWCNDSRTETQSVKSNERYEDID